MRDLGTSSTGGYPDPAATVMADNPLPCAEKRDRQVQIVCHAFTRTWHPLGIPSCSVGGPGPRSSRRTPASSPACSAAPPEHH